MFQFVVKPGRPTAVVVSKGGAVPVQGGGGVQGSSLHWEVGDGQATGHVSPYLSHHCPLYYLQLVQKQHL